MKKLLILSVTFVSLVAIQSAQAQSTWLPTSGSNIWENGANWSTNPTYPNSAGAVANFTALNGSTEQVTVVADTVGTINIGAASNAHTYNITGGTLTLNNSGSGAAINELSTANTDFIASAISMADTNATTALTISNASAHTLTVSGGITSTSTGSNLVFYATGVGAITILTNAINNQGTITNSGTSTGLVTISGGVGSNVTGITTSGSTSELLINSAITTNTSVGTTLTSTTTGGSELMDIIGGIGGSGNLILDANGSNTFATGAIKIETGNITTTGSILNSGSGSSPVYITSSITAASSVTENGTSPLALSGNNTYSGNTILTSGQLLIGSTTALGTGTLVINGGTIDGNGGTIVMTNNNPQTWNASFGFTGARALTFGTGAISLGGNVTLTTSTHANLLTENGAISGTGNLTFNDNSTASVTLAGGVNNTGTITNSGTSTGVTTISGNIGSSVGLITENSTGNSPLILSGTNTNANGVTLTAGTLKLGSTTALGATASTLTIGGGSLDSTVANLTLANNNAQNWNGSFIFVGSNNLNLGTGAVTLDATPTVTLTAGTLTEGGVIGGAFGLTVVGPGTLTLTGANTYTGVTTVTSGTLSINSIANKVGGTPNALGEATGTNAIIALGGGTLQFTGSSNGSSDRVMNLTGSSTLDASGAATFALSGGVTAPLTASSFGLTLTGTGLGTESGTIGTDSTHQITSLTKNGTGTWIYSSGNEFIKTGGKTTVNQGTLEFTSTGSLYNGSTSQWTATNIIVKSGATLAIGVGGSGFNSGSLDTLLTGASGIMSAGTAAAGLEAGSTLGLDTTSGNFSYNTTITNNSVSGAIGLSKLGTNSLTLGGPNTYSGGTTVNAGTLVAASTTGSATGTGALSVLRGAALAGTGTSSGTSFAIGGTSGSGTASVYVGQTAATGDTNTTNNLTLKGSGASTIANANLTFNLNTTAGGGNELVVGSTAITFGSGAVGANPVTLTLNLQGGGTGGNVPYFVLIAGTVATPFTSQYSGLSLGTGFSADGGTLTPILNSGVGGSGNLILALNLNGSPSFYGGQSGLYLFQTSGGIDDIVVIPEPGTWALMLGGLTLLVFIQRSRRQRR